MGTTGERSKETGVYKATCSAGHTTRILLSEREPFPPCGGVAPGTLCGAAVAWQRETVPPPKP